MDIQIRLYKDKDLEDIKKLIIMVQDKEISLEEDRLPSVEMIDKYMDFLFAQIKEKDGCIWIAEIDGRVVGLIDGWIDLIDYEIISKPIKCFFVADLVVLPEYRGKGVAKALIKHVESFVRSKDLIRIKLSVLPKNNPAINLYKQMGFKEYEIDMVKRID